MLRDHLLNFLETAVAVLMLTNVFSAITAAYALSLARSPVRGSQKPNRLGLFSLLVWRKRMNASPVPH